MLDSQPQTEDKVDALSARLLLARIILGDPVALDQYAQWIRGVGPKSLLNSEGLASFYRDSLLRVLSPLWQHSDHPAIAATTDWLFDDKDSPWNTIVALGQSSDAQLSGRILFYPSEAPKAKVFLDDLNSPLITLPAFRRRVARLLQDRHVIGQVEIVNNEEIFHGCDR